MTREECLKKAQECVMGQREQDYGSPEDNFRKIANLWNAYLGFDDISDSHYDEICSMEPGLNLSISPKDVAMMMALMKIARASGVNATDDCFVDLAGYSACGAEIMSESVNKEYTYSYAHDKLANYVSVKAKEEHVPLANLKSINRKFPRELSDYLDKASTDCVMNGKRFRDCYKELDEMFAKYKPDIKKYNSFWDAYENISEHIASSSNKAGAHILDVVDYLTRNGHAPTEMAALLMDNKLDFDDVATYVDDAINEIKENQNETK